MLFHTNLQSAFDHRGSRLKAAFRLTGGHSALRTRLPSMYFTASCA